MSISIIDGSENSQVSANYAPDESRIIEQTQQADFIDSLMISKDKDGDGILDLDESGLRKKEFSKYDVDGNGRISVAEVQAKLEQMQQQKGAIGKLDVEMQQAENSAGDGKVSQSDIDAAKSAEKQGEDEGSDFSKALSEFEKSFFSRKKDDEDEKDLNKDGVVTDEEREQPAKVTGLNAEKNEESSDDRQGKSFSARQMAGVRAYQDQAANVFVSAAQSSVKFEY